MRLPTLPPLPGPRTALTLAALSLTALSLAGCVEETAPVVVPPPEPRAPAPVVVEPQPSPESRALAAHYRRIEALRRTQGKLRDVPDPGIALTAGELERNFIRIALYEELSDVDGMLLAQERAKSLSRWSEPVRIGVEFRGLVTEERRASDRARVAAYAARLADATGHPVSVVDGEPNFRVLVVDEEARRALGPDLRRIFPDITASGVAQFTEMPRSTYCLLAASDRDGDGSFDAAVAVIRAEQPDLLRLACLHEEIAQGLGLSNDSPAARPSIFNDDDEFATLTRHDELLLRILYDPRLTPGMTAAEARPVVREIVAQLLPGPS